jgi:hypothetical protein
VKRLRLAVAAALVAAVFSLTKAFAIAGSASSNGDTSITDRAQQIFRSGVRAVAVREPFAVVNYDAPIEGQRATGQALFRHYGFGWQMVALAIGSFRRCDLLANGVPRAFVASLSVNAMGPPRFRQPPCAPPQAFVAAVSPDEEAIRSLNQDSYTVAYPKAVIENDWALLSWYGAGGGTSVWRKQKGHWRLLTGGGGAVDACSLIQLAGTPPDIAHRLVTRRYGNGSPLARIGDCRPTPHD